MADDLDDNFWVKEDISDEKIETKDENENTHSGSNKKSNKRKVKKRKLKDLTNENKHESPAVESKKKKKKKKNSCAVEEIENLPPTVTLLWDFFESELNKSLTTLEIEDLKPSNDDWFLDESTSERDTKEMSAYLSNVISDWTDKCVKLTEDDLHSSPILLIVTLSAIRAVDVLRATSTFRGEKCKTMKLFAKHIKVNEQLERLKTNVVHLGVGTPNRISKLIEEGGINTKRLKYVIIDWSWKDLKQRRITSMPGVKDELLSLFKTYFLPRCKKNKLWVGLF
ncbi:protein CMSS1-like [Hydractinia symbiolongicarpus]|uniref:protein CMSS1-like n=1 Tax=Hydractinia symbiolongicarpus TaxID=13093 RepID=UPI0025500F2E|nr:protein CMSS1-like [Hydractinia symbiolongicarpus]